MAAGKPCYLLLLLALFTGLLASPSAADQVLYPRSTLSSGASLTLGSRRLTMQPDCNLVVYNGGTATWASRTNGQGSGCRATMQNDGNLVVYNGAGRAVWSSGTARGGGNYVLVLQSDGNLVIYGSSIWATGTNAAGTTVPGTSSKGVLLTSEASAAKAVDAGEADAETAKP